ncbi:unnamed protein product [Menidia menidia]|uniref:(Atlantic silverside) hypothetical protein n=1 Tax=Menidia menidia TaxID=238744 RepID=A0A8S4BNX5_9TELE|nr:unnamed protein product [Menidia menidia]
MFLCIGEVQEQLQEGNPFACASGRSRSTAPPGCDTQDLRFRSGYSSPQFPVHPENGSWMGFIFP